MSSGARVTDDNYQHIAAGISYEQFQDLYRAMNVENEYSLVCTQCECQLVLSMEEVHLLPDYFYEALALKCSGNCANTFDQIAAYCTLRQKSKAKVLKYNQDEETLRMMEAGKYPQLFTKPSANKNNVRLFLPFDFRAAKALGRASDRIMNGDASRTHNRVGIPTAQTYTQ